MRGEQILPGKGSKIKVFVFLILEINNETFSRIFEMEKSGTFRPLSSWRAGEDVHCKSPARLSVCFFFYGFVFRSGKTGKLEEKERKIMDFIFQRGQLRGTHDGLGISRPKKFLPKSKAEETFVFRCFLCFFSLDCLFMCFVFEHGMLVSFFRRRPGALKYSACWTLQRDPVVRFFR